jgi:hypothetical protein
MSYSERTPAEWFAAAARCYQEGHQACAWCGGAYQVFRTTQGTSMEYHCNHCDFHVGHDADLDRYTFVPGENNTRRIARLTMHDS